MKINTGLIRPEAMTEDWPGQYENGSHLETLAGIPRVLSLITTRKADGKANACFFAGGAFASDAGGYYAILAGLYPGGHTYTNIIREKEFCINFLSPKYYGACIATIENNREDADELLAANLTHELAAQVKAPRVGEAFLTLECRFVSEHDPSGLGKMRVVTGQVANMAIAEEIRGVDSAISPDGFMAYLYAASDPRSGENRRSVIARYQFERES